MLKSQIQHHNQNMLPFSQHTDKVTEREWENRGKRERKERKKIRHKTSKYGRIWWPSVNLFLAVDVFITKSTNHYTTVLRLRIFSFWLLLPPQLKHCHPLNTPNSNTPPPPITCWEPKKVTHTSLSSQFCYWSTQYFQRRQ